MFNPLTNPVDFFEVAGQRSPGIATLKGVALTRSVDERKGYGLAGATTVVKGQKLAKFSAEVRLFEPAHFEQWQSFVDVLRKLIVARGKASGFSFSHPQTDQLGISAVVVEEINSPEQTGDGEWTATIKFVEHRQPRPMLARTEGSSTGLSAPMDANDIIIQGLAAQVQELAGR